MLITQAWFTATFDIETVPHPAIVFEDNAFYGDSNGLWRQTDANVQPTKILTLAGTQVIIALGIDRGTGLMLISTTSTFNISNTGTGVHRLHWYDGYSNKTRKTVIVDDLICGFYNLGNITFVGYGQNLGYISGSGINFLRRFRNVGLAQLQLPYKHNFAHIGSTLYVIDGDQILAYGPVLAGGPSVFYYLYLNDIAADAVFSCIFNAGSNNLGMACPTSKFHTLATRSVANLSNGLELHSNWYYFPRPVILRGARIEFEDAVSTVNNSLNYSLDGDDDSLALSVIGGNITSAYQANYVGFRPEPTTRVKFNINTGTTNAGFKMLIVHYDYVE